MVKVVLDTCIFDTDRSMSKGDFSRLAAGISRTNVRLVVPEVVRREFIKHVRQQVRDNFNEAAGLAAKIKSLSGNNIGTGFGVVNDHVESAEQAALLRLKNMGTNFEGLPEIGIEALLERDLDARKPFDEKGNGLRDTLIIRSVIEVAKKSTDQIVFVTGNHTHFATKENKDQFHEHIAKEIADEIGDPSRLEIMNTLGDFNKKYVIPKLDHLDAIQGELLQLGKWKSFNLAHEIQIGIEAYVTRIAGSLGTTPAVGLREDQGLEMKIREIQEPESLIVLDLSDTQILVMLQVSFTVALSISDLWSGQPPLDENLFAAALANASSDSRERTFTNTSRGPVITTSTLQDTHARCLITVDSSTGEVVSFDVETLKVEHRSPSADSE